MRTLSLQKLTIVVCISGGFSLACLALFLCKEKLSAPPERPMFHNHYGPHPDHGFFDRWWPVIPVCDRQGNQLWADLDDNVLLILARSISCEEYGQVDPLSAGIKEARLRLANGQHILIERCNNEIIVVSATGDFKSFLLGEGQAEVFFKQVGKQDVDNLFSLLAPLLKSEKGMSASRKL